MQEKAIAHPTNARCTHRAFKMLANLTKYEAIELGRGRPAYERPGLKQSIGSMI